MNDENRLSSLGAMTVTAWIRNNSFIASLWELFSLSNSFSKLQTDSLIFENSFAEICPQLKLE